MWLKKLSLLFALQTTMLLIESGRAQETTSRNSSSTAIKEPAQEPDCEIVREFLQQMEQLSDDDIQTAAEKLSQRLLAELKFGPAIEQMKHRRASMHRLRDSLQCDLGKIEEWLIRTRERLSGQVHELRELGSVDGALCEKRVRTLVEVNAQAIRSAQQRAATFRSQIEQATKQIDQCVVHEKLASDGLVLSNTAQPETVALSELPPPTTSIWFEMPDSNIASPSDAKAANDPRSLDRMLAELGVK